MSWFRLSANVQLEETSNGQTRDANEIIILLELGPTLKIDISSNIGEMRFSLKNSLSNALVKSAFTDSEGASRTTFPIRG